MKTDKLYHLNAGLVIAAAACWFFGTAIGLAAGAIAGAAKEAGTRQPWRAGVGRLLSNSDGRRFWHCACPLAYLMLVSVLSFWIYMAASLWVAVKMDWPIELDEAR